MAQDRGTFGRMGFIVAAAGSAVGLGNIWKFPYITYENGGGTFVLVYLTAVLMIGAPIMAAEILIGRNTGLSPVSAFKALGSRVLGGRAWAVVGWLGVASGGIILSYYSVIAGWTVYYFGRCLAWSFGGFTDEAAANLGSDFATFLANGPLQIGFHAFFMALTMGVVVLGVKAGIERVTKLLMPVLAGILFVLVVNSWFAPGFSEAFRFLFHIGPISAASTLEAVGHAFFTLSLGMGALITYGSYVDRQQSIPRATGVVCLFDTLMGMAACIIMFTIIFSVPEAERLATFTSKSATILFTTLPRAFYALPLGMALAPLFYALVAFAALTSTISIIEVVVSYFIDERQWSRRKATLSAGSLIFLMGIPAALSLGASETLSSLWRGGVFGTLDYLVSNWAMPVGGFFIALFTGWFLSGKLTANELEEGHGTFKLYAVWRLLLRFVCPIAIAWIIFAVINGKDFA